MGNISNCNMGDGEKMKPQVTSEHYYKLGYDSKERFCNYWHQINEIQKLDPETILEIGVGNRFVYEYLKKRKSHIYSMDIDRKLNPDTIGSLIEMPFADDSFDVVLCCEVLEHIPYDFFGKAMKEIYMVSKGYVIISLPDATRSYKIDIQLPPIRRIRKVVTFPKCRKPEHIFDGEHYWEIGKKGYSLRRIVEDMKEAGLYLQSTFRVFEHPYHRFFVLKKMCEYL